ncbi:YCF48-related protein [Pseudomonas sp.]|uniref:WD40/YVTN/BNR-like repeat-containing protein n=1 Tax=Pseudomonas sp. TaxID=306 RepID=UPI002611D1C1|nr:YCF48-related protein [Pseudomonas sp.]
MIARNLSLVSFPLIFMLMTWFAADAGVHAAEAPPTAEPKSASVQQMGAALGSRRLNQAAAPVNSPTHAAMQAVSTAASRIVVAGERGLIAYSDDCGVTWQQANVPVSVTLTALSFVDAHHGWAVGHDGVILATQDAGSSWQKQLDGKAIAELALGAAKKAVAIAPSSGDAQRELSDAERLVADGPDKPLFAVHFWTPERGLVIGAYGLALLTEDAGRTWQWIGDRIPNPMGFHLYGLWVHGNQVYVVGEQGLVVRSEDGASHFQSVASPYEGSYFGITSVGTPDSGHLIVYGLRGHAFELSAQSSNLIPLPLGLEASLLSASPGPNDSVLLFDADGQVVEVSGTDGSVRPIGNSPVGPVLGVAASCGNSMVVAGLRGVAIVDATTMVAGSSTGTTK